MRIVQILPVLAFGDAIGNDARALKGILCDAGYETEIYAESIDPRLPEESGKLLENMPVLNDRDILLYHACTGTPMNYELPKYKGKKVLIYHNITPPFYFHKYAPDVEIIQEDAYAGIRFLSDKIDYCLAVSEFNKSDLRGLGFVCPIDVCPILISFNDYLTEPDPDVLKDAARRDTTNILFVGRVVPNKKHEDIIRGFSCYVRNYNARARLNLVGNYAGMENYYLDLVKYVKCLGIEDKVLFTGHVSFKEILAYYRSAHLFVCMSEHEGFCVPLIESMVFNLPIIAYSSSAVPETLGTGGVLLQNKDPYILAAAMNRTITDHDLRECILYEQKKELSRFRYESVKKQFLNCIQKIINL